ncbi:MAG TPA: methyltransferase domain-containing protein [Gemmataceae bacterium]|jgi:23S rRNA G2445 N2-methylase RlmL|nr:methyltransferase domain-containing protein [Gemmataceae bacterium]
MSRSRRAERETPACFATVPTGLEAVAADEITRDLGGDVKKADKGIVVFRVPEIGPDLLRLRTCDDVFLLAWGTDSLTYKADDLKSIRQWTTKESDWQHLLSLHHAIRPKPKGKPSYRLVTQMGGTHGYRRMDAGQAMAQGLGGVFPPSWQPAEENASVEIWLIIRGRTAVCGVRLSDKLMRHRAYKVEHQPASLRPTVAGAMVRLAGAGPGEIVLDPMCGAGTIIAEQIELSKMRKAGRIETWGGDRDMNMLRAAETNLQRVGPALLTHWDATRLPLARESVDRVVCNLPFGKQMSSPEEIGPLYRAAMRESNRVLKPGGRVVLLVSEADVLREAIKPLRWQPTRQLELEVLGQPASIGVWQKPAGSGTVSRSE